MTSSAGDVSGSGSGGSVPPTPPAAPIAAGAGSGPAGRDPATSLPSWRWRYGDAEGREVDTAARPSPVFTSQADAESWVGEFWRDLVAAGVDTVTLEVDGRSVYGPMSLHPVAE